jgi:hypothetical protein
MGTEEWRDRGTARLARDDVLGLDPGPGGVVLRGLAGTVLATQAGDPEDHVLEPGVAVHLPGRGRVVLWAFEPATVAVEPA